VRAVCSHASSIHSACGDGGRLQSTIVGVELQHELLYKWCGGSNKAVVQLDLGPNSRADAVEGRVHGGEVTW